MNEIILPSNATATATSGGLNAGLLNATAGLLNVTNALKQAIWPAQEPVYTIPQNTPTYSLFKESLANAPASASLDFAEEIASVFASLSEGQEPLGAEFEAVWEENLDALYQS